jgi:N-acetylneuraminate synthase/N,N'-diacetyllegionaminate synthase
MKIGDIDVGPSHPPFFIAEAGVNHNGNLDTAKELIDVAADAGADAVKFQTFSADRLVTPEASKAEYQTEKTGEGSQYDMLKQYELDHESHEVLFEYCKKKNIMFLSTPFDQKSANLLAELGVNAIKLGSGELDNIPLIKHVSQFGISLIVSTGMGTLEEVVEAHEAIQSVNPDIDVVFLHCTSAYPCSIDDVHLRAMQTMRDELEVSVGYSDHTTLPETPALAVAAGACVLDSTLPGPDHEASLEPDELEQSINLVDIASRALGTPDKEPTPAELDNLQKTRKSLHAAVDIPEGTRIKEEHLDIIRPAEGISPKQYETLLGSKTSHDLAKNTPITFKDIQAKSHRSE